MLNFFVWPEIAKKLFSQIFEFLYFLLIWKPKEAREEIAERERAKKEERKSQTEKKIHERKKKSARSAFCDIHNNNTRTHLRAHRTHTHTHIYAINP